MKIKLNTSYDSNSISMETVDEDGKATPLMTGILGAGDSIISPENKKQLRIIEGMVSLWKNYLGH